MPRRHLTGRQIQIFILGASLAAFVGAFISVGLPRHVSRIEPMRSAPVRVLQPGTAATNDVRLRLVELLDPSLLALPSRHGFSGKPWTRAPAVTYEPSEFGVAPAMLEWTRPPERPRLIDQTPLAALVQTAAERTALEPLATHEVVVPPPPAPGQSTFRIFGELAARTVVRAPSPVAIESAVPVRAALVRIGVGADGLVRYAALERSSGETTVDARAVGLAREFRFEPRAQATLAPTFEWGVVKFLWAFAAPAPSPAP